MTHSFPTRRSSYLTVVLTSSGNTKLYSLNQIDIKKRIRLGRCAPAGMTGGSASGHPEGAQVEVEHGLQLVAVVLVHLPQLQDLAHDLDVEAVALGLGEDVADVGGAGRLLLLQALAPPDA